MRLQGFSPARFKVNIPLSKLRRLLGNAMSVCVIERLLLEVLRAIGFAHDLEDRWATGAAQNDLSSTRGFAMQGGPSRRHSQKAVGSKLARISYCRRFERALS